MKHTWDASKCLVFTSMPCKAATHQYFNHRSVDHFFEINRIKKHTFSTRYTTLYSSGFTRPTICALIVSFAIGEGAGLIRECIDVIDWSLQPRCHAGFRNELVNCLSLKGEVSYCLVKTTNLQNRSKGSSSQRCICSGLETRAESGESSWTTAAQGMSDGDSQ